MCSFLRENKKDEVKESNKASSSNPFEEDDDAPIEDPSNPFFEAGGGEGDPKSDSEGGKKMKSGEAQKKPSDPAPPTTAGSSNLFSGIISQCFEPYLTIYLESQDRNLTDLVNRAAQDQQSRGSSGMALEGSAVLHSCGDLFMFYKKCMVQCAQLSSTGATLVALAAIFKKHLREYATKVLLENLPKGSSSSSTSSSSAATALTSSMSMTSITRCRSKIYLAKCFSN